MWCIFLQEKVLDTLKDKVTGKNYRFERDELDNVTAVYEVDSSDVQIPSGYGEAYAYNSAGKLAKKTIVGSVPQEYTYTYSDNSKRSLKTLSTPIATEEYEDDCLDRNKKIVQTFGVNTFGKRFAYKKVGDHTTNQIQSEYIILKVYYTITKYAKNIVFLR